MAKGWKQIGFFTRRERRGIILLLVLLTGALASSRILDSYLAKRNTYPRQQWIEDSLLLDSLVTYLRQPQEKQGQAWEKTRHRKAVRPLTPVTFNPNRADSADFADMGLPGWMARNIVRYREAGGKFRSPDDFRKIYGLTEAQFDTLRPYISIAPEDTARPVVPPSVCAASRHGQPAQGVEVSAGYNRRPQPGGHHRTEKDTRHRQRHSTHDCRIPATTGRISPLGTTGRNTSGLRAAAVVAAGGHYVHNAH